MFGKILKELILIRKELQVIRNNLERNEFIPEDSDGQYERQSGCAKN